MCGCLDGDMVRHSTYPGDLPDGRFCFRTFSPPPHAASEARHPTEDLDVHGGWDVQLVIQRAARVEEHIDVRAVGRAADLSSHSAPLSVSFRHTVMRRSCQPGKANLLSARHFRVPSGVRKSARSARFSAGAGVPQAMAQLPSNRWQHCCSGSSTVALR